MSPLFGPDKDALRFSARIKKGASIGQDFAFMRWPECKAPGGKRFARDPDMIFQAIMDDSGFDLIAPGFGGEGDYGNGSIWVTKLTDLVISDEDKERVSIELRSKKQKEIDAAVKRLTDLQDDLARI